MTFDRWAELIMAFLVFATYGAKTLYEQSKTIREDRLIVKTDGSSQGISVKSSELVNLVSMANLIAALAQGQVKMQEVITEGQIKMQEAIIHLTTVIEERLPNRRR